MKNQPMQILMMVALAFFSLVAAYVGGYFILLRQTTATTWPVIIKNTQVTAFDWSPSYRGLPAAFFEPIHEFDRERLRPAHWEYTSSIPWRASPSTNDAPETKP